MNTVNSDMLLFIYCSSPAIQQENIQFQMKPVTYKQTHILLALLHPLVLVDLHTDTHWCGCITFINFVTKAFCVVRVFICEKKILVLLEYDSKNKKYNYFYNYDYYCVSVMCGRT